MAGPLPFEAPSAVTAVDGLDTPLLVTAGGGDDWRCPPTQSEQRSNAPKRPGVDAKLVVDPNGHNDIGDPDQAIHRREELDSCT